VKITVVQSAEEVAGHAVSVLDRAGLAITAGTGTTAAASVALAGQGISSHNWQEILEGGVGVVVSLAGLVLGHSSIAKSAVAHAAAWVGKEDPKAQSIANTAAGVANQAIGIANQAAGDAQKAIAAAPGVVTKVEDMVKDPAFAAGVRDVLKAL
jgi:hypothetical protein